MALPPRSSRLRPLAVAFALLAAGAASTPGRALAAPPPAPAPLRPHLFDTARHSDAGRLNLFTTNFGHFAWDFATGSPGLVWPRGTSQTAVFASGLWLGGRVGGQVRVAVAEYSSEYRPGGMVGGTFDDPYRPEHRVYKVVRWTGNPADSMHLDRTPAELAADPLLDPLGHHAWSEYLAGAKPYGAPTRIYRLPDTTTPQPDDSVDVEGPDVLGDQMLWEVHNDADPAGHTNSAGLTQPLGVEIQQTTFAFDRTDGLGNIVFLKFRILNRGGNTLDDLHVSVWSDPDLGEPSDDLVGCDIARGLGYAYNATASDAIYGTPPPAVGYVLLRGLTDPASGNSLGLTAFGKYINGTDPQAAGETYHAMQGLLPDGSVLIDPTTNLPTRYFVPGDPVSGQGWLDTNPADRRFLLSSGPIRMLPGEVQEVWAAIVVGRGGDRLASVSAVRCLADIASNAARSNFILLPDSPVTCSGAPVLNCPKPAAFWALECAAGGAALTPQQLDAVAGFVNAQATLFDWPGDPRGAFCATLDPPGVPDLRQQARREFAAFLANFSGSSLDLSLGTGQRIRLEPSTPVACPPLRAASLGELAATAPLTPGFRDGIYWNHVTTHPQALEGVDVGLPGFGGGAGTASDFLGSSLDPATAPDSFATVSLRFDHTVTQNAYRYLRLERQSDGLPPPQGRGYLYGGHRTVPFTCWDDDHGVQLDVAFVERTVTDDLGTLLGPAFQPATHDSTWGPDDSATGGREYLIVFRRPYSATPKAELAQDGLVFSGSPPALYALWSKLRSAADVIDDGDAFEFRWGPPSSPGADSLLVELEGLPLADPSVQARYQALIDCLSQINHGIGIGLTCESPTATALSLVSAEASPDRVILRWYSAALGLVARVERRIGRGDWVVIGRVAPGGDGMLVFEDRDVVAGGVYDYRLAIDGDTGVEFLGETRVSVPLDAVLAFLGLRPSPADGRLLLGFSLATREPARLELLDVAGRRMVARDLAGLAPGSHVLDLKGERLPAGIYLVRITQGRERATGKAAVVR